MDAAAVLQAMPRAAHMAALLSLFGSLVFAIAIVPAASALQPSLRRVAGTSAAAALALGLLWLAVETAAIAGADTPAAILRALPVIVWRTQFGHGLLLRFCLLLAAVPLLGAGPAVAVVLVGAALAVQPILGHAGAIGGSAGALLIVSEALHLLAAGAWLGGLLPLWLAVTRLPPAEAAAACRGFTPVGLSAVLLLAGTAVVQTVEFIGGLPGLLGTGYGRTALVKLGLFVALLGLAAANRLWLTDRLAGAGADRARAHIRVSIAAEGVLGAAVVAVAALLASHLPAAHEQPVWPLSWRPSLDALAFPDLARDVAGGAIAATCAAVLAALGLFRRSWRWPSLAAAVLLLVLAAPLLSPLIEPATPTTFFASPTDFATTSIANGQRLFLRDCATCHGAQGRGDGPAAASLPVAPADLTAEHLWAHGDGDMFWYLTHGIDAPGGGLSMPGFAATLSSEARWNLIDYLRARNAGDAMRRLGTWPHPLPVPQFDAKCPGGHIVDLDDLAGRALRIVAISGDAEPAPLAEAGPATIVLARNPAVVAESDACVALEPATWAAFAIIAGVPPEALAGTAWLADGNHWLRVLHPPGDAADAQALSMQLRDIAAHPLPPDAGGARGHRH
jgi:putative copper export protein/mono/diheme cytochrome c family protein